jgi:hypothetical protein
MMLEGEIPITGPQIEAALRLLGWSISDLAERAGMEIADLQDMVNATSLPKQRRQDLAIIKATLEEVGMEFTDTVGVHFRPPDLKSFTKHDRPRTVR